MDLLYTLSDFMIPIVIFYILADALAGRTPVYDAFVTGAKGAIRTVGSILPALVGLMAAAGMLRASGLLDLLARLLAAPARLLHFPEQLIPLVLVRFFSSSAATSLMLDLYKEYGTDSRIGMTASIVMSCTETVFYTMSVYFLTAKISKARWTLAGALCSTLVGIVAGSILAAAL